MSKKKLAGIIAGCVIAVIAVIVITTHFPEYTREPEQIAVSAYDCPEQLFDPGLTSLQKEEVWEAYEGRQVRWINELKDVELGEQGPVAYCLNPLDWERSEIKAVFDESQRSSLLELEEGDLVIYTGVLTSFGRSSGDAEICLMDCAVVSLLTLESLWWNSYLGEMYSTFENIDHDYVYVMVLQDFHRMLDVGYLHLKPLGSCSMMALDRVYGGIVDIDASCDVYRWFPMNNLSNRAYNDEGVTYRSVSCVVYGGAGTNCDTLQAIDQQTGSVLWMKTFEGPGMNDFLVFDGILYLSTDNGVGAFELPNLADLQNPNRSATGI